MRFSLAVIALAACFHVPLAAETTDAPSLMAQLRAARSAVSTPPAGKEQFDVPRAVTNLAYLQTFTGDAGGALETVDRASGKDGEVIKPSRRHLASLDGAAAENAIAAIVAAARNKRAVLINESHTVPQHRAFSQKLAAVLRKIGFTYLACEAFSDAVTDLAYVRERDGFYLRDPVFAGFVNDAVKAGYRLVPYEYDDTHEQHLSPKASAERRELVQAQNIYRRIFEKDKGAKVLIHVGHHHLLKKSPPGLTLMGTHLRRMLGPNATLHVDQTLLYARSAPRYEHPMYRTILSRFPAREPFVLRSKRGGHLTFLGQSGVTDMDVIFPVYGSGHGRPGWLTELAGRKPHPVPAGMLPASGERLVLAYETAHGKDAVPTDVVLIKAGQEPPSLMLPEGQFRFEMQD